MVSCDVGRLRYDVLSSEMAQIDLNEQRKADVLNRGRHHRSLMDLIDHDKNLNSSMSNSVAGDDKHRFICANGIPSSRMSYLVVDPELGSDQFYQSAGLRASIHLSPRTSRNPIFRKIESINNVLKHSQRRLTKSTTSDKSNNTINQSEFRREFPFVGTFHAKSRIHTLKLALSAGGKLSRAFAILQNAAEDLDPPRLYFQAGLLFDDVNVHDKAEKCFMRSIRQVDITDFEVKENPAAIRKFRIMNSKQKQKYLTCQEAKRVIYIKEEQDRQQLRAIISHIKLVRLRIIIGDSIGCHNSLLAAFEQCVTHDEHVLVLQLMHIFLSEMSMYHSESSVGNSTRSDRTLIDAHIWILKEMIRRDIGPMDEVLEWLGRRCTNLGDLLNAKQNFKMARDVRSGLEVDLSQVTEQVIVNSEVACSSRVVKEMFDSGNVILCAATGRFGATSTDHSGQHCKRGVSAVENFRNKCMLAQHHSSESAEEAGAISVRADPRHAAHTIIYAVPSMGWDSAIIDGDSATPVSAAHQIACLRLQDGEQIAHTVLSRAVVPHIQRR